MNQSIEKRCDVLIIGGALAGGCLARQLILQQPDLKIIVIDKKEKFDWWIGESTVTPWGDYAVRQLKLGPYLWKNHMMKHGLRFFFDSPDKQTPIDEMSEIGRIGYSAFPSFQLDRATFDADLARMNQELGVEVLMNTRVEGRTDEELKRAIIIDPENGHRVETSAGTIRCRWVVDAGGRTAPLVKRLDLLNHDDKRHNAGAYWGRYKNCIPFDQLGDDEWRRKVQYTDRYLSTTHFMYPGYWFWHIPLSENLLSIGVDFSQDHAPMTLKNGAELTAFIRSHRCLDQILGKDAECLDFLAFKYNHRHTKQFFSADRWALTGMAGSVVDALLSETCVGITLTNRCIGELIKTDRSGNQARFASQVKHFNIIAEKRHDAITRQYKFDRLGSFEYYLGHRQAQMSYVFNNPVREGLRGTGIDTAIATSDMHVNGCECSWEKELKAVNAGLFGTLERLDQEFYDFLVKSDSYFRLNRGEFHDDAERASITQNFWSKKPDRERQSAEDRVTYETAFRFYLSGVAESQKVPWSEVAFKKFFSHDLSLKQTLADGVAALRLAAESDQARKEEPPAWTVKGPINGVDGGWRRQ